MVNVTVGTKHKSLMLDPSNDCRRLAEHDAGHAIGRTRQICKPMEDRVIADVVRQSRQARARRRCVPLLSITLVRHCSGNAAWRLTEAVIAERSVGALWQSGSSKRSGLELTLVLCQMAGSLRLGEGWPARPALKWHALRQERYHRDKKQMRAGHSNFPAPFAALSQSRQGDG